MNSVDRAIHHVFGLTVTGCWVGEGVSVRGGVYVCVRRCVWGWGGVGRGVKQRRKAVRGGGGWWFVASHFSFPPLCLICSSPTVLLELQRA